MNTIRIKPLMKNKSYPEAGSDLYRFIEERIGSQEKIEIDLSGVDALPSMFLNVSIGKLVDAYGFMPIVKKITFTNISSSQIDRIKTYLFSIAKV